MTELDKVAVIEKFFPEIITEKIFNSEVKKAINFDKLKDILSINISDAPEAWKNFAPVRGWIHKFWHGAKYLHWGRQPRRLETFKTIVPEQSQNDLH